MRIEISEKEKVILENVGVIIDLSKDYSEDEIEDILEEIYFNESTNVDYNEKLANTFADIADKIENMRED